MARKLRKYTKEFLTPKVEQVTSITQLIILLGLKATGGNFRLLQQRINQHNISTAHFTGQGWAKGLSKYTSKSIKKSTDKNKTPHNDVFCVNSGFPSSKLKYRLLELGWENKCKICGLSKWLNNPITLHVDHINGVSGDNRLENLRILCPNCHQQTDTWGNKNGNMVKLLNTSGLEPDAERFDGWSPSIPTNTCDDCGKCCGNKSKRCKSCASIKRNASILKRVAKEVLVEDLNTIKTYSGIAKKYGVSDVSIKKWCRFYQL